MNTKAYGAYAGDMPLEPIDIQRRAPGPRDVQVDIKYCGVCHSDLHTVRSEWPGTLYPCVPGHEIVGHVISAHLPRPIGQPLRVAVIGRAQHQRC